MKTFFLIFALFILSTSVFAQTTFLHNFQNSYDSTTSANNDTLKVWDLSKSYPSVFLTVENLSATVACTLQVRGATFIRNDDSWNVNEWESPITDTTYYMVNLRDYTWANATSIILEADSSATYWIAKENLEGLKAYMTNTTGGNCRVIVEGTKPTK